MKILPSTLLVLMSSTSWANECPSIQGSYRWQGEGASTRISMAQEGCTLIHLEMDAGEDDRLMRDLTPDGVRRQIERSDGVDAIEWSQWSESGIRINLEERYRESGTTIGTHAHWTVNAQGDLVEDLLITRDGSAIYQNSAIFHRQQQR